MSYPNSWGAKAPLGAHWRCTKSFCGLTTDALLYCGAYLLSSTPCVRWPPIYPSQLAPTTLPWASLSLPLPCSGFLTRNDVSRPCSGGAKASRCFTIKLLSSMLPRLPTHPGQLEPTTLPRCRLAPFSCSVGLSPPLSLSLSPSLSLLPTLSLSLSFSRVLLPLRPTLSFSRIKGVSGRSVDLYPPRGSNPPPQDRRGVVYPLSYDELLSASLVSFFPTPPCVSSPVRHIAFRMGVCSAACRGTAQRPRVPGPPA